MFLSQRYTCENLKDIGTHFGIGESGVSQASRRVNDKIRSNKKLKRKIRKIEKRMNV
jgi:chromosomal replication initiation ATPase DnaA